MNKWKFKKIKWNTRNLLILCTCAFMFCILFLTVTAIGLKESGVKPKEDAVSATVNFTTYLYGEECYDEIKVKVVDKKGLADIRELESCVKNCTLKEYTDMSVWGAEFTYMKEDGTKEERTYRKTGMSKDIDKFLDKYYEP